MGKEQLAERLLCWRSRVDSQKLRQNKLRPEDYTTVMLRSALIPARARNPADAGRMIDFLAGMGARPALSARTGLPPVDAAALSARPGLSPIRLGPGLLAGLDRLKRRAFLAAWSSAMEQ